MSLRHMFFALLCKWICKIHKWKRSIFPGRGKLMIVKTDGLGDMLLFLPYLKTIQRWCKENTCDMILVVTPVVAPLLERFSPCCKIIVQPIYRNFIQWAYFRIFFCFWNYADFVIKAQCLPSDLVEFYPPEQIISCGTSLPDNEYAINICNKSVYLWNEEIVKAVGAEPEAGKVDYNYFCDPVPAEYDPGDNYIVVCPDASDQHRCWEIEKFALLIDQLYQKFLCRIVLTGSTPYYGENLKKQCIHKNAVLNLCGKTTVFQLFTIVKKAHFLVSNETGTAHIGGVTETRTFIICGKGHYGIFVPYPPEKEGKTVFSIFSNGKCSHCNWLASCIDMRSNDPYQCIADITVDEVYTKICQVMKHN